MSNSIHKGTELNNVSETWDRNERIKNESSRADSSTYDEATPTTELDQVVKKEAAAYDNENSEDRLLGGDRASLNDDPIAGG